MGRLGRGKAFTPRGRPKILFLFLITILKRVSILDFSFTRFASEIFFIRLTNYFFCLWPLWPTRPASDFRSISSAALSSLSSSPSFSSLLFSYLSILILYSAAEFLMLFSVRLHYYFFVAKIP